MTRDSRIQLLAAACLALFLGLAGVLGVALASSAGRHKLTYTDRAEEGQPPQVALGIALGAFRGLFVNMLWMRANEMKEEGRYYEAVELAKAVTQLQPRFPRAWAFHAWNMAYNISVTTQTRQERWQWVQEGIRLLRDKAIPANPNDLIIHKELAWIYLHKVQGTTDDNNLYYKSKHAEEWTVLLGPPPRLGPNERDVKQAIARYVEWLTPIEKAPETLEQAIALEPTVAGLVERLRSDAQLEPGFDLLKRYEALRAVRGSGRRGVLEGSFGSKFKALAALVDEPAFQKAWPVLLNHTRKRVLVDTYKMELGRMIRYTQKYGPMDWRHPASHGLYWSARGVELARAWVRGKSWQKFDPMDFDFVNTDRIVIHSLQELYRSGTIYFDFLTFIQTQRASFYMASVQPHFVDAYGDIIEEIRAKSPFDDMNQRAYSFYSGGYENFLKDAVRYFYRRGQTEKAQKYYTRLGTYQGQNLNDAHRALDLSKPIEDFVRQELVDRQASPYVAQSEIDAALDSAYADGLFAGDDELFRVQMQYAKDFHAYYVLKQHRFTAVNPDRARTEIFDRDFGQVAGARFAIFASSIPLDDAAAVYNRAPIELRVYAYDFLQERYRQALTAEVAKGGRAFDELFPEPPGMAAHRQMLERRAQEQGANRPELELK